MEKAKAILREYGIPEDKLGNVAFAVAGAMDEMWDRNDIALVAEEQGLSLTEEQFDAVLSRWTSSDSYATIDREGIEWAIHRVMKGE